MRDQCTILSKNPGGYTADETAETVQNLLICIEMFGFSVAHHFVFSYKPFLSGQSGVRKGSDCI